MQIVQYNEYELYMFNDMFNGSNRKLEMQGT